MVVNNQTILENLKQIDDNELIHIVFIRILFAVGSTATDIDSLGFLSGI